MDDAPMKWFKKPKPEKQYVAFATEPPLPPCPVHGDKCGLIRFDNKWFPTHQPCEAWEAAIKRAEWSQTHDYYFDPKTQNFVPYQR